MRTIRSKAALLALALMLAATPAFAQRSFSFASCIPQQYCPQQSWVKGNNASSCNPGYNCGQSACGGGQSCAGNACNNGQNCAGNACDGNQNCAGNSCNGNQNCAGNTCGQTVKPSKPSKPSEPSQPTTPSGSSMSAMAQELVRQTNADRAKNGLSALSVDAGLTRAACIRAQEIVEKFSHTRPDGSKVYALSDRARGENIAKGQQTVDKVMAAWMSSEGHRANILRASFQSIGVCAYKVGNVMYWVQVFGN